MEKMCVSHELERENHYAAAYFCSVNNLSRIGRTLVIESMAAVCTLRLRSGPRGPEGVGKRTDKSINAILTPPPLKDGTLGMNSLLNCLFGSHRRARGAKVQ